MALDTTGLRSRRALLMGTVGGLAALAAQALGRPAAVNAHDPDDVRLGDDNITTSTTEIENTTADETAFSATATGSGSGVIGSSTTGYGIGGFSTTGIGVVGFSGDNVAVGGLAFGTGDGIYGDSALGRGGRFKGKKAQIRLNPSTAATHPNSGAGGDLFVDASKRLWFCKGGTSWVRLG